MPVEERLELMAIIGSNGVDAEREFFDNIINKLNRVLLCMPLKNL